MIKNEKYAPVSNCPVRIYGLSTGRAPIQVSKITITINVQNIAWLTG